jgi:hypothetical protein
LSREIPDKDWKVFRKLREGALERFAEQILNDVVRICSDDARSAHERYLAVYRLLQERDRAMAMAFDNLSRSRMFEHLLAMRSLGLLTAAELADMSRETKARIELLTEIRNG